MNIKAKIINKKTEGCGVKKTFIIAEAGVNHNGKIEQALQLVDKAADAGADCVKFQTFITENEMVKDAEKAEYQKKSTGDTENEFEMVKKLELSFEEFRQIKKYCERKNILFLSTPFDLESIDFLESLDIFCWKVPSGEVTNLPYLIKIAKTKRDIIMSTGMCELDEVRQAVRILEENGSGKITLLHCNTEYPTPYEDVNLLAMDTLKREFQLDVGYSDHTLGIEVPIAAAAKGATVIEKHFTLDRNMEGPDHKASLEPDELKQMIISIRNIEKVLGNGEKIPSNSEKKNISVARKSIVAKKPIKKGEMFTEENLAVKRPGSGINPMRWNEVVGLYAGKDYMEDEQITL